MKFDKSILFFIILAVALLSTLGMNIKEGLTPESVTGTRKKDENMEKVKVTILDPCIKYLVDQFYPYIIATCVIFILTFILAIAIFIMIIKDRTTGL